MRGLHSLRTSFSSRSLRNVFRSSGSAPSSRAASPTSQTSSALSGCSYQAYGPPADLFAARGSRSPSTASTASSRSLLLEPIVDAEMEEEKRAFGPALEFLEPRPQPMFGSMDATIC
ncbi:MAG: hypothetical protein M1832_005884 [Thelocarpon impressellum]|nr:MAG: hypothetical protein M1832_005884 [Thelocarpon impressellum]